MKRFPIGETVMASVLGMTLLSGAAASASAATLDVPADYATIQAAVDAAQAGDTVLVAPGTYPESVALKAGVNLQGSGAEVTTIEGDGTLVDGLYGFTCTVLGADDSAISGFTITGSEEGITNIYASPIITKNILTGNKLSGISNRHDSAPIITDNVVTRNGIIGVNNYTRSRAIITNNTIADNREYGIFSWASYPTIVNNVITGNRNYGVRIWSSAPPAVAYNNAWGNGIDIDDSYSSPAVHDNISADPLYVTPNRGDYRLRPDSPCVDAGTNDAPGLSDSDLDGNPRVFDGDGDVIAVVDMGAFEYTGPPAPPPAEELPPGAEEPAPGFRQGEKQGWEGGAPRGFDQGKKEGWKE
ncbi:MAG: NosD domain-containing protein [Elusimicrobiota bacterium]